MQGMLFFTAEKTLVSPNGDRFTLNAEFVASPGITVLFGASGAGKSTLLSCLAGLETPDRGRIVIDNETYFDSEGRINKPVRDRRIGYVFQNLALFPHLTVAENIAFGLRHISKNEQRALVNEMLEKFGIGHIALRPASQISGGEAQRVALARALVTKPKLLLLDEPLSALDAENKQLLISDLKRLCKENALPVIYVTHSRDEAVSLGEQMIVLNDGVVRERTTPLEYFAAVSEINRAESLHSVENLLPATVELWDESRGAMTVRLHSLLTVPGEKSDCRLEIPFGNCALHEEIAVAIPSGDILVATQEPKGLSARNVFKGRVTELKTDHGEVLLVIACGERYDVPFVASLTQAAVDELQISEGMEVWLIIKAHACRVVR